MGKLYIIIDKNKLNTKDRFRRLQFHFETKQFMDVYDKDIKMEQKQKFVNYFKHKVNTWFVLKYDMVYGFINNIARVELNKKWGFIDISGNEICDIIYDDVWNFKDNIAIVKLNNKWGAIDN